jgi:hypothetical protein
MHLMNDKVYGWWELVYGLNEKDKEILQKRSKYWKRRCRAVNSSRTRAISWCIMPIGFRNDKVYGWMAVDHELGHQDKETCEK